MKTEYDLTGAPDVTVPMLPRSEFWAVPMLPKNAARPQDWDAIIASDSWKKAAPEARLNLLAKHAKHTLQYLVQSGADPETARQEAAGFFNDWRLHALDNAINPGEQASSQFVTGLSDFVFGAVGGVGAQMATQPKIDVSTSYDLSAQDEGALRQRWAKLRTPEQRRAFKDEVRYKHGIDVEEDGKGEPWFFPRDPGGVSGDMESIAAIPEIGAKLLSWGKAKKDETRANIESILRKNPGLAETFLLGDLPQGFASVLGFVATGALTGPAGVAATGAAIQAESAYFTAKEAGATDEQTRQQVGIQSVIGASEVFGVGGGINLLKRTPFGKLVESGVVRYLFGGVKESAEEIFQDTMVNVSEKYGGIDPERVVFDPKTMIRTAGVAMITGTSLAGLERTDADLLRKAQKAANGITRDIATSVLDGTHPATKAADMVLASPEATEEQKQQAQAVKDMAQARAQEMLGAVAQSESILNVTGEPQETGRELTPIEKVMDAEGLVNLREMDDAGFTAYWKDSLSQDERRKIRTALGVKENAPVAKIMAAFREKTADVAKEPDIAAMALPELIGYHDTLSQERGQAPSRVTLYKTSKELTAELPEATDAAKEAGASAVGKDINPDDLQVLGANWREREGEVERGAIAIVEGKTAPLILAREKAQEWFRRAHDEGTYTIDELRQARAEVEKATGEKDTHADTDEGMMEWASDYAVDYLAGKAPEARSLPQKVREFFQRLGEFAADMVRRAIRLERAIKSGGVNARFESALAQASGLQAGEQFNAYQGLSTQESAHLAKMLADPAKADEYLASNDVSDAVVERLDEAQRRGKAEAASAGKIRGPMFTMGQPMFPEENRLTSLNPKGGSWSAISRENPGVSPTSSEVTIYRATIGNEIRPGEFVALNKKIAKGHLSLLRDRGETGRVVEMKVALGDLLLANDATEFIFSPKSSPLFTLAPKAKQSRMSREILRDHREELANLEREIRAQRLDAKPATEMERRLSLIGHIRTLERIVSAMPKELRGQLGGWSRLVKTGTPAKRIEQLEKATDKAAILLDKHAKNVLLLDADKLFAIGKVRLDKKRRATSKMGPEAAKELADIRRVAEMKGDDVSAELAKLTASVATITDPEESARVQAEMLHLLRFGDLKGRNVDELFTAVEDIRALIEEGKLAWKAANETRIQENKRQRQGFIKGSIEGGKGWRNSSQGVTEEDRKGTLRRALERLSAGNLDWAYVLNWISRADSATGHMGSDLVKWGTRLVHKATKQMERMQNAADEELARFLAGVSGIDTNKLSWKFKLKRAWAKFDERSLQQVWRMEIPNDARYKANILLKTARGLRDGTINRSEGDFTEGQERAILSALTEFEAELSATQQSAEEAKAELDAARLAGAPADELLELQKITREQETKLRNLKKSDSLKGVDLTDMTKAQNVQQTLSQSQMVRISMSWRQADVRPIMEYHGYSEETLNQIEAALTPEAKALRAFLSEKYETGYEALNAVYRRIYGADMPKVKNYSPMSYFHENQKPDMQFGSDVQGSGSLSPGFTFSRLPTHRAEPNFEVGALALYGRHVAQQAHFISFAEPVRQLRAVLGHKDAQQAINRYYGKQANTAVQKFIQYFADKGNKAAEVEPIVDRIRRNIVLSGLSWNWTQVFKQPTGAFAYLYGVPAGKFAKYEMEFMSNPAKAWKLMSEIPFVQERYSGGGERDIMAVLTGSLDRKPGGEVEMPSRISEVLNVGMWFVRAGDLASTIVGGYAAYRHGQETALKNGATEEEAHEEGVYALESMTELYQTGANVKDMSPREMGGSWERLFTTFLGNARKYYLATWDVVGDVKAGRAGAKQELAKRVLIGHVVLPLAWQSSVSLLKLMTGDDDDREEALNPMNWAISMAMGPLSGVYVFGQGLDMIARRALGMRVFAKPMPIVAEMDKLGISLNDLIKAADDGITAGEIASFVNDLNRALSKFTGGLPMAYDVAARILGSAGLDDDLKRLMDE